MWPKAFFLCKIEVKKFAPTHTHPPADKQKVIIAEGSDRHIAYIQIATDISFLFQLVGGGAGVLDYSSGHLKWLTFNFLCSRIIKLTRNFFKMVMFVLLECINCLLNIIYPSKIRAYFTHKILNIDGEKLRRKFWKVVYFFFFYFVFVQKLSSINFFFRSKMFCFTWKVFFSFSKCENIRD